MSSRGILGSAGEISVSHLREDAGVAVSQNPRGAFSTRPPTPPLETSEPHKTFEPPAERKFASETKSATFIGTGGEEI